MAAPSKWMNDVHRHGLDASGDNISLGSSESDIESLYISESDDVEQGDEYMKLLIATAYRQERKKNMPWNDDYETEITFHTESDSSTTSDDDEEQTKVITNTTKRELSSPCKNDASCETEHTSQTSETQSNTSAEEGDDELSTASSSSKRVRFSFEPSGSKQGEGEIDPCEEHSFRSSRTNQGEGQPDEHARAMEKLFKLLTSKSNDHAAENRQAALRMGAPLAVVKAMRSNKYHVVVQKYACRCLAAIAWNTESVDQVLKAGGLEASLSAFYRFHHNIVLQRAICKLIGNLWMFRKQNNSSHNKKSCSSTARRQRVVDAGGLKAVIRAMKGHPQNRDVQRRACYALQSLVRTGTSSSTSTSSSFVRSAVKAGGVKLVILAMNNHLGDAGAGAGCKELQLDACRFLHRVAKDSNGKYRAKIVKAKGLVAIGEALRVHGKDEHVRKIVRRSMKVVVCSRCNVNEMIS
jgi:hypothetical protein